MTSTTFAHRRQCGRHRTVHTAASDGQSAQVDRHERSDRGAGAGTPPIQHRRCTDPRSEGAETAELSQDPRPQPRLGETSGVERGECRS